MESKQHVKVLRYNFSFLFCFFSWETLQSAPPEGFFSFLLLFLLPLHHLGSAQQPARRAHMGTFARHLVRGILPFIHFLMRSNETVFGRVPESCVLASAALGLTFHPSLFRAFPPHLCVTGSAAQRPGDGEECCSWLSGAPAG